MKKSKVIIISLLGILLFVPFMTSARAQTTAANVSLTEGDYYNWELSLYWGATKDAWDVDNMTAHFAEAFGHGSSNVSAAFASWEYYWNVPPQAGMPYWINEIGPVNATTGEQDINITTGYTHTWGYGYMGVDNVWGNETHTTVNNTADLAEAWSNGSLLTTPNWIAYVFNSVIISPDVNWTEMAEICDAGLKWGLLNDSLDYNLTVSALTNGISIFMPANEFGNNSRSITLSSTYYANGFLSHYTFMYGNDMLLEVWLEDDVDPVVTVAPIDATVANNYTGESLSWTATDADPGLYTIWVNTTEVASDIAWTSATPVVYNIPDGLGTGIHTYRIIIMTFRF